MAWERLREEIAEEFESFVPDTSGAEWMAWKCERESTRGQDSRLRYLRKKQNPEWYANELARNRARYIRTGDQKKTRMRANYAEDEAMRDKTRLRARAWRAKNRERIRAYKKTYRARPEVRERHRLELRAWREKNKDHIRSYKQAKRRKTA